MIDWGQNLGVASSTTAQTLPLQDTSIVHDQWSINDVGIDLFTSNGYLIVASVAEGKTLPTIRVELPIVNATEYHAGTANNTNGWKIRAIAFDSDPTKLQIAGSFDSSTGHNSTLSYIKWYRN